MAYLGRAALEAMGFLHLGREVRISDRASVYDACRMRIGDHSRIDDFCVISGAVTLGRNVHIAPYCLIAGGRGGVVLGNPLGARHVVRWLLYRPGLRDPYDFGPDEMFFRAGEMSDLPELTGGAPELFLWKINPAYRDEARPDRAGVCYLVRKGDGKPRIPETETADAICIDGLSHEETAAVFNRCRTFYSYDEASFWSVSRLICIAKHHLSR